MTLSTPEEVAHMQPVYIVALEEHKETAIAQCLIISDAIRADRAGIAREVRKDEQLLTAILNDQEGPPRTHKEWMHFVNSLNTLREHQTQLLKELEEKK